MADEPPDFCPRCGSRSSAVNPPTVHYCESCGENVVHTPVPTARLAVIDGRSILLVEVDLPDRDLWGTPGGTVEANEGPDETGARELEAETTRSVDPSDLVSFDASTFPKSDTVHKTYLAYAVDAKDVDGRPRADQEVSAARCWTPAELEAAVDQLLTSWPAAYQNLHWWVESARDALLKEPTTKEQ